MSRRAEHSKRLVILAFYNISRTKCAFIMTVKWVRVHQVQIMTDHCDFDTTRGGSASKDVHLFAVIIQLVTVKVKSTRLRDSAATYYQYIQASLAKFMQQTTEAAENKKIEDQVKRSNRQISREFSLATFCSSYLTVPCVFFNIQQFTSFLFSLFCNIFSVFPPFRLVLRERNLQLFDFIVFLYIRRRSARILI